MKRKEILVNYLILYIFTVIMFFPQVDLCFATEVFPIKVKIINKNQAKYNNPVNAFIASYSATMNKDLEWALETLTKESSDELVSIFTKKNIDLNKIVDHDGANEETFIITEIPYKESMILIIKDVSQDGSIMQIPLTFLIEHGEWKKTNKFANDKNINQYMSYYERKPLTTQLNINYSGVRYDRRTRQFSSNVTITNISDKELAGPVWLKIKNLQPPEAVLVNADGMHFDEPYLIMLGEEEKWQPGQALPVKNFYFTNPVRQRITFDDEVFAVVPDEDSQF